MRPSNVCVDKLRSVACQKAHPLRIENKEMMRDLVTDYILKSLTGNNQSLSRRCKQAKYQPLSIKVEVNGSLQKFDFPLSSVLEKYVQLEKASA